jgi:SAM-dependent methyltransferase
MKDATERTIRDFGEQWTRYQDNEGYYGSFEVLVDHCGPLLEPEALRGRRVAEIGSGTGRIVRMLLEAGAAQVLATEPSDAFAVLVRNLEDQRERVRFLRVTGDRLPPAGDFDFVFAVGVLHHIPDPLPALRAAHAALRAGGRLFVWLYGREGNAAYCLAVDTLRRLTTRLPHAALAALVWLLHPPLALYAAACRLLPLPLHGYLRGVFGKMSREKQRLILYDQLRPAYAKYYRREEVVALLAAAGFEQIRLYHRHGYSWSALASRPETPDSPGPREIPGSGR